MGFVDVGRCIYNKNKCQKQVKIGLRALADACSQHGVLKGRTLTFWDLLGLSASAFGVLFGSLGAILDALGAFLEQYWGMLCALGALWDHFGRI